MTESNPASKDPNPGDSLDGIVRQISDTPQTDKKLLRLDMAGRPVDDEGWQFQHPVVAAGFARELEHENARLRERKITPYQLGEILMNEGIVQPDAVERPEAYDNGSKELAILLAARRINDILSNVQRSESTPK